MGMTVTGQHLPSVAETASQIWASAPPHPPQSCSRTNNSCGSIMRVALLLLALTAVCNGILPEIVHPGISHILGDYYGQTEQNQLDDEYVEVEQLSEDLQQKTEDALQPVGILLSILSSFQPQHCNKLLFKMLVCIVISEGF